MQKTILTLPAVLLSFFITCREATKEVTISDAILNMYTGTYEATFTQNKTLTIYKKEGKLYAGLSDGTGKNMVMIPQSETKFLLPDIKHTLTTFDFMNENDKAVKLVVTQDKKYEWRKIK